LIFDVDGNTFIDLAGGLGMLAVGHSPAVVVRAIEDQARKYIHPCALVTTYEPYVRLAELLNEIAPGAFAKKTILANIGAEPVQGEAGFVPVPPRFLRRVRELCTEHGIVLIADEVQCGMGRTGRLFAVEHYDIVPDLITTAKSLGAGMPIAAVTGRAEIMDASHLGGVGSTYGGSPVACAAAIEAVNIIRRPEFLA